MRRPTPSRFEPPITWPVPSEMALASARSGSRRLDPPSARLARSEMALAGTGGDDQFVCATPTTTSHAGVSDSLTAVLTGLGLGIALAGAPGPVQALLLTEALRGGVGRGLRAMLGANITLGVLLLALALGVSFAVPSEPVLRVLKVVGGAFLVYLGVDGFRSVSASVSGVDPNVEGRREVPPAARAALAVILNPPAWLFLATAASSLMASATQVGGTGTAVLAALALLLGVAAGDGTLIVAGGLGLRRARSDIGRQIRRALAIVLALLGASLIVSGLLS